MTVLPSPTSGNEKDPLIEALEHVAKVLVPDEEPDALVEQGRMHTVVALNEALDRTTSIISGIDDAGQIEHNARTLADRHQEHYIAQQIVTVIEQLKVNPNDKAALTLLAQLRKKANESGFFLMLYTVDMMIQCLTSPQYVVAQAYGRHPNPKNPLHHVVLPGADCQCWVPPVDGFNLADYDFPNLQTDRVIDRHLTQKFIDEPWLFGEVKDITSSLAMTGLRMAGAARAAAFKHITQEINPQRSDRPVRYMNAAIANVTGIVLPDGTPLRFIEVGGKASLKNERSMDIHIRGSYPATHAFTLHDRTVPVIMNNQEYKILVDWMTYVHDLQNAH